MSNEPDNEIKSNISNFPIKTRVYWGISSLGTAIVSGIFASLLSIFYTDYLGLADDSEIVTTVALVYALWNAFNDPLFGFLSDSTKSSKGRRIPYMRYTAPFLAITFALVWFAPADAGDTAVFWWMLVTMILYDTAYTIIGIVYSALLPEITENENGRNQLQVFANFFYLIGTIFGFLIPDFFRNQPGGSFFPLQMAMIAVGVFGGACVFYTSFKFKERPEFTQVDDPLGFWDSIKYTFKSKSFIILAIANFMSILMQALILGSLFYMADYVTQSDTILLLICVFVPLIVGIWITPKMIAKWGVLKSDQILLVIGGIGLILVTFVPVEFIYVAIFIGGIGLVGPLQFTNLMFAQVADEDELKSGVRREAAFFGVNALITKPAQSVALAIPAILLDWANFIPRSETGGIADPSVQLDAVAMVIRIFIGLIPGIALILEALLLQMYPLKGKYLDEVKQKTLDLHSEKHSKLKEAER